MCTVGGIHKKKVDRDERTEKGAYHGRRAFIVSDFLSKGYIPVILRFRIGRPKNPIPKAPKGRSKRLSKVESTKPGRKCVGRLR
jgi:hypothetical protein